jgi:hypothetical protein
MDFLGLTTLTLIEDALKLIKKRHGGASCPKICRSTTGHLRDFLQGLHQRRLPVRIAGHARHSAPLPARAAWKT